MCFLSFNFLVIIKFINCLSYDLFHLTAFDSCIILVIWLTDFSICRSAKTSITCIKRVTRFTCITLLHLLPLLYLRWGSRWRQFQAQWLVRCSWVMSTSDSTCMGDHRERPCAVNLCLYCYCADTDAKWMNQPTCVVADWNCCYLYQWR